jgi:cytochrome c oxidase assembly protein subunit 15
MVGGVLYEHGHRMVAAAVGLLTIVLAVWTCLSEPRAWVRALAVAASLAVIVQGLLGGLTVLLGLPTAVSVAHACLAQAFLGAVVTLAVVTGGAWGEDVWRARVGASDAAYSALPRLCTALATLVYAQLIVGAIVRHTGAGLAIPDFPLAYGRLVPPLDVPAVRVHFLHRLGAVVVAFATGWTVAHIAWRHRHEPRLVRPALLTLALVVAQIGLGALTIWTHKAVVPTTAHVAAGAAILATTVVLALRAHRAAAAAAPGPSRVALPRQALA